MAKYTLRGITLRVICISKGVVSLWIVTTDYVRGVLAYFVENIATGERRGTFDCERWAKEFADELNREGVK